MTATTTETTALRIAHLADHPETIPQLQKWFESEWDAYYGPQGPGDAATDLASFARRDELPVGLVAFRGTELCGIAALKSEPIESHPHLIPWAAAGMVAPGHRGQGIGAQLLVALEGVARELGYPKMYCYTGTSESLLMRGGWTLIERAVQDGEKLTVFEKVL